MRHASHKSSGYPIEALECRRLLNAGDLDTSFGTGGGSASLFGQSPPVAFFAVAVQSDGKIVAAGATNVSEGIGALSQVLVARFNTNGSLDSSFSGDGFAGSPCSNTHRPLRMRITRWL